MPHNSIGIIEFTDYAPAASFLNKVLKNPVIKYLKNQEIDNELISLVFEGDYDLLIKEFEEAKLFLKNGELFSECFIKDPHLQISNIFLKGN